MKAQVPDALQRRSLVGHALRRGQAIFGTPMSGALFAAVLSMTALLVAAIPASAATITDRPLLFSFDGSDTSAGRIEEMRGGVAVDESTGNVYVIDLAKDVLDKFDAEGTGENFSTAGTSSLTGSETPGGAFNFLANPRENADVAVDNSPVNPGRIYITNAAYVDAFSPAGSFLWRLSTAENGACGAAVDGEGHLWLSDQTNGMVREYANTGSPPVEIASFPVSEPCSLAVAANGDVYVLSESNLLKYAGGILTATIDTEARAFTVDESNPAGHVFSLHAGPGDDSVEEFDSSGSLLGIFGLGVLYESQGVAYNSALDRLYVGQFVGPNSPNRTNTIKALGAVTTGTVPDATTEEPGEVGVSSATLHGTVNPQSVPNTFFFEWKEGTAGFGWREAKSTPATVLPEDSTDHAVSFALAELKGGTTYQVRVVATNSENQLRNVSAPVTFTTAAPAPPAETIDEPSGVTTSAADISGTVNPQGDFGTTWRLQFSTDPACASNFVNGPLHELNSESEAPVAVSEHATGLLPNQHYCVRISAENAGGPTTSAPKEFTTDPVAPTDAFTAFAAPRTDTSARLNGRVDPEGADAAHPLVYRFEYSADDGATWTALPDRQYTGGERGQIVVAEQISGLVPGTTYSYRFIAEDDAGPALAQGEVKTFTTRTTAEMAHPERGIELVNNPDKGNQNVFIPEQHINVLPPQRMEMSSPDGNEAIWSVTGGAPGGNNGTQSVFLAERTATGWQSRSLAPPASEQVGEGGLAYEIRAVTPDFSRFIFDAQQPQVFSVERPGTLVRLDQTQHQQILKSYEIKPREADITADGAHVVVLDATRKQLEDIGTGTPEVVSVMPDGTESECGLDTEQGSSFIEGGSAGGTGVIWRPGYHMIATTDASRVYFGARPNHECTKPYGLYVRNREAGTTTLIDPGASENVAFIRATPDGRQAYFATKSRLDPADTNGDIDVYRWSEESGKATCLTCVVPDAAIAEFANSYTPILVSDDFSHIYFESPKQLVPGYGTAGQQSLYVLSNGSLRFVTQTYGHETLERQARLSPDGNVLVFESQGERAVAADEVATDGKGHKLAELYRYDDRDGSVECLSCLREGTTTQGVGDGETLAGMELSGDGSTVAFVTPEALLASDVNRKPDVYEWHDGTIQLVTNGITEFVSGSLAGPHVRGMDSTGSNIFFSVADPGLTGFEQDGLANLYDARIGGGFVPPSPPSHCTEDSCQGPLQAAPPELHPDTASFAGAGNVHEHHHCSSLSRRARKVRGQARRLLSQARRVAPQNGQRAKAMRSHAVRLGKQAQRLSRQAKRCKRAGGRAGR